VLRDGTKDDSIPTFAKTRVFIDFREDAEYLESLESLLRDILTTPANPKPTLGSSPFAGSDGVVIKSEIRQNLLEVVAAPDPEKAFAHSVHLLRQRDAIGWKALFRNTAKACTRSLLSWRALAEKDPDPYRNMARHIMDAVSSVAPIFVIALTATESGESGVNVQRSLLDDLIRPPSWNLAGYDWIVEMPRALGFIYHHLLGAHLIQESQQLDALRLLTMDVTDSDSAGTSPLWCSAELMGWCRPFEGNCEVSWDFVVGLYKRLRWLAHFFPYERDYLEAIGAYRVLASLVDFAMAVKASPSDEKTTFKPHLQVHPGFLNTREIVENLRTSIRKAVPDKLSISRLADLVGVHEEKLRTFWPLWFRAWFGWNNSVRGERTYAIHFAKRIPQLP